MLLSVRGVRREAEHPPSWLILDAARERVGVAGRRPDLGRPECLTHTALQLGEALLPLEPCLDQEQVLVLGWAAVGWEWVDLQGSGFQNADNRLTGF